MSYAERMFHKMNDDYRRKIVGLEERSSSSITQLYLMETFLSITFRLPETITAKRNQWQKLYRSFICR